MAEVFVHGPLVMRLVARLFPLRQSLPEGTSLKVLRTKYLKWERINALEFLLLAAAAVYGLHVTLVSYTAVRTRSDPSAVYTLRPDSGFWYFPAALMGCVVAGALVRVLNEFMIPGGAEEYRSFSNVNAGFNVSRMFAAIGIVVLAFGGLLTYFAASNKVVLRQNEIVFHRLWSFQEETHAYAEISAIKSVHDQQNNSNDFEIEFAHGEPWSTQVEIIYFTPEHLNFLAQRSSKPVQQIVKQ